MQKLSESLCIGTSVLIGIEITKASNIDEFLKRLKEVIESQNFVLYII